MAGHSGPKIETSGLILNIDAKNKRSFSGVGNDRVGQILPAWNPWVA